MVDYDPFMDEVLEDPYPVYRRLREESPVHYLERWNAWALARFEDIWTASEDTEHFTVTHGTSAPQLLTRNMPVFANLNHMDPPEHTRVRKALARHFLPRRVRSLEPQIRGFAREAIASFRDRGECDAVREFGARVAAQVACLAVGFPRADSERIVDMVTRFFSREEGTSGMSETGRIAYEEMQAYLQQIARERRKNVEAHDDPISTFLKLEIGNAPLDDAAMATHLTLLLVGATETFPKVFGSCLRRLWEHPDQREELRRDPSLIPDAFRELLRYDMPTQFLARTATREVDIHGHRIQPGQVVLFLYPSGNRDEREFERPDELDIHRHPPRILSFGQGTHRCLGSHVAEMEGRILLEETLREIPEYEVHLDRAIRERTEFVQGFTGLPISF